MGTANDQGNERDYKKIDDPSFHSAFPNYFAPCFGLLHYFTTNRRLEARTSARYYLFPSDRAPSFFADRGVCLEIPIPSGSRCGEWKG